MDKKLYRIVESGGNYRHEFLGKNRSPLFESIPNKDFGYEQKTSYYNFLKDEFRKLIFSYFPINIINYNNNAVCNVRDIIFHDPESKKISISEDDTKNNSIT